MGEENSLPNHSIPLSKPLIFLSGRGAIEPLLMNIKGKEDGLNNSDID